MSESQRPRIVVGVDGSPPSKAALRWAQRLATAERTRIDVVGAWAWRRDPARSGRAVRPCGGRFARPMLEVSGNSDTCDAEPKGVAR
jgi:nucleotide-binding universal stress UspA family protein